MCWQGSWPGTQKWVYAMLNLIALAVFSAAVTVPMVIVTLRRPLVQNA